MSLADSRLDTVEEMMHGVLVNDPYRWLERRALPETDEWITEQHQRCDAYFANCKELPAIRDRVRDYLDVDVIDQPARVRHLYFYRRRKMGQEQPSIYVLDTFTDRERLLVDPSSFGPFASVGIHRINQDGSLLAYEFKQGGGDRRSIHLLDVARVQILPDQIETGYVTGFSFTPFDSGFYYSRNVANLSGSYTICLHRFGTTGEDPVLFRIDSVPGSRLILTADRTRLGAVHTHLREGKEVVDLWIADQNDPGQWHQVFANREGPYSPILRHGRLFVLSYTKARTGSLVELDFSGNEVGTVIPERTAKIRDLVVVGDIAFVNYLDKTIPSIEYWNLSGGKLGSLGVPQDGTIRLLPAQAGHAESIFYTHESLTQPAAIFELDTHTKRVHLWHHRAVPTVLPQGSSWEASYPSKDRASIPITLASRGPSGFKQHRPLIMTSYGGFGVSMTPQFSVLAFIMMELGASFALPHIRGGGELGRDWHDAARRRNRQTAFDDFVAAAEWLCSQRITAPEYCGIFGGSNSGLLVGAALTQRPDLFRAALCIAPLLDMVRYECFDQASKWAEEYGTVANPEEFAALYAYSPYHHIANDVDYPSVLFVTGDEDDRCNPAHVRKMAARLQNRNVQKSSVIVDYSKQRGHSPAMPLSVRIEALARRIAFLCRELNLPAVFGGSNETPRH